MDLLQPLQNSTITPPDESRATCGVDWSPDEDRFVMGGKSRVLRMLSAEGEQQWEGSGHTDWIRALRWAPEGDFVATGSDDRTVRIWDTDSGSCRKTLSGGHTDWVRAVDVSPDGQYVASGADDKKVVLWDVGSGSQVWSHTRHDGWLYSLRFSPSGDRLASGGSGSRDVLIWDVGSGSVNTTLKGHSSDLRGIAWSPDGGLIASIDSSGSLHIWDPETGEQLHKFSVEGTGNAVAWSPDGALLVVGSSAGTIAVDPETGETHQKASTGSAISVAFSPSGEFLVVGLDSSGVRTFSVDGAGAPISGGGGRGSRWRPQLPNSRGRRLGYLEVDGGAETPAVALSSGGQQLLIGGEGLLGLWRLDEDVAALHEWKGHEGQIHAVAWARDDARAASGGAGGRVRVWDIESRSMLYDLEGHSGAVLSVSFDPTGQRLASSGADGTVRIWDLSTQQCVRTLLGGGGWVRVVAWSPDGRTLAAGTDEGAVYLWETGEFSVDRVLRRHSGWVHDVSWAPNSKLLVSGGEDMTLVVWDLKGGTDTALEGHQGAVFGVSWATSGKKIASTGGDRTVRSWDARRLKEASSDKDDEGYPGPIAAAGSFCVTGHTDGFVFAWAL